MPAYPSVVYDRTKRRHLSMAGSHCHLRFSTKSFVLFVSLLVGALFIVQTYEYVIQRSNRSLHLLRLMEIR